MSAQEWLDRTQGIADAATEGPWFLSPHEYDPVWGAVVTGGVDEDDNDQEPCIEAGTRTDARFIAHARTALPVAVAALRAVLDQHRAAACQRTVPRMLRSTPEDHLPYRPCDGCGEEWPCATVTTITEAIQSGGPHVVARPAAH